MSFLKLIFFVVFAIFFFVGDSTQFHVANCVWDDALSGVPIDGLRGFVLSDADACALFCSKTGVGGIVTAPSGAQSAATSAPSAALCDRCCKSSQPPSKPGELLVSILQTLINAFGPTKTTDSQTGTSSSGAGVGPGNGSGGSEGKPAPELPPASSSLTPTTEEEEEPDFDPVGGGFTSGVVDNRKAENFVYHDSNNHDFEPSNGPFTAAEPRHSRAVFPVGRIVEINGRDDGPTYNDGFDHATDRGPGWHHRGVDNPLKSGTIR